MFQIWVKQITFRCFAFTQLRYSSGSVKSFNNKKGFGFIHPDFELQNDIIKHYGSWKDVFVHYSSINDDVKLLLPTTKVDFDCVFDKNGPVAHNVLKIIPKRQRMVIEKWMDAPPNIDKLVQKKEILNAQLWTRYMREFYRRISEKSLSGDVEYFDSSISVPSARKNHLDYIEMANDVLASLSQSTFYFEDRKDK